MEPDNSSGCEADHIAVTLYGCDRTDVIATCSGDKENPLRGYVATAAPRFIGDFSGRTESYEGPSEHPAYIVGMQSETNLRLPLASIGIGFDFLIAGWSSLVAR